MGWMSTAFCYCGAFFVISSCIGYQDSVVENLYLSREGRQIRPMKTYVIQFALYVPLIFTVVLANFLESSVLSRISRKRAIQACLVLAAVSLFIMSKVRRKQKWATVICLVFQQAMYACSMLLLQSLYDDYLKKEAGLRARAFAWLSGINWCIAGQVLGTLLIVLAEQFPVHVPLKIFMPNLPILALMFVTMKLGLDEKEVEQKKNEEDTATSEANKGKQKRADKQQAAIQETASFGAKMQLFLSDGTTRPLLVYMFCRVAAKNFIQHDFPKVWLPRLGIHPVMAVGYFGSLSLAGFIGLLAVLPTLNQQRYLNCLRTAGVLMQPCLMPAVMLVLHMATKKQIADVMHVIFGIHALLYGIESAFLKVFIFEKAASFPFKIRLTYFGLMVSASVIGEAFMGQVFARVFRSFGQEAAYGLAGGMALTAALVALFALKK